MKITELLKKEAYNLFHFSESIENNELNFDHKIKAGMLKTRNAIKILEIYKYPSEITENARNIEKTYFKEN